MGQMGQSRSKQKLVWDYKIQENKQTNKIGRKQKRERGEVEE